MKWYHVKGYEGDYEVSEDLTVVRSVPRERWFGNSLRKVPPCIMRKNEKGRYCLRSLSKGRRYVPASEIEKGEFVREDK